MIYTLTFGLTNIIEDFALKVLNSIVRGGIGSKQAQLSIKFSIQDKGHVIKWSYPAYLGCNLCPWHNIERIRSVREGYSLDAWPWYNSLPCIVRNSR